MPRGWGQLRQDVEGSPAAQRLSLHQSLSEVQTDMDIKLKKLLKPRSLWGSIAAWSSQQQGQQQGQSQRA